MAAFADTPQGPSDPMFYLKQASDSDTSPEKIDVGIGGIVEASLDTMSSQASPRPKASSRSRTLAMRFISLYKASSRHVAYLIQYLPTTGMKSFIDKATQLLFGADSNLVRGKRIASVQTVGGTGAVRLGAAFLNSNYPSHSQSVRLPNKTKVYVGTPTWPNYIPLFKHAGLHLETFNYFDRSRSSVDITAGSGAIALAPKGSIFVFQVCCHNPSGQDYDQAQWVQLADAVKARGHFVFFDIAYQGFASSMDTDAWPSFSKHMGLYSERVGVLHIICSTSTIATNVKDQLRSLTRWEVSSTPAYGARLANIFMQNDNLYQEWMTDVQAACDRMIWVRQALYDALVNRLQTWGKWGHILQERGLLWYFNLNKEQVRRLRHEHHVYLAESGRVNIAGLNQGNVQRFAAAIESVVRTTEAEVGSRRRESRL